MKIILSYEQMRGCLLRELFNLSIVGISNVFLFIQFDDFILVSTVSESYRES